MVGPDGTVHADWFGQAADRIAKLVEFDRDYGQKRKSTQREYDQLKHAIENYDASVQRQHRSNPLSGLLGGLKSEPAPIKTQRARLAELSAQRFMTQGQVDALQEQAASSARLAKQAVDELVPSVQAFGQAPENIDRAIVIETGFQTNLRHCLVFKPSALTALQFADANQPLGLLGGELAGMVEAAGARNGELFRQRIAQIDSDDALARFRAQYLASPAAKRGLEASGAMPAFQERQQLLAERAQAARAKAQAEARAREAQAQRQAEAERAAAQRAQEAEAARFAAQDKAQSSKTGEPTQAQMLAALNGRLNAAKANSKAQGEAGCNAMNSGSQNPLDGIACLMLGTRAADAGRDISIDYFEKVGCKPAVAAGYMCDYLIRAKAPIMGAFTTSNAAATVNTKRFVRSSRGWIVVD
ncbi:hypothetical protein MTR62_11235 [Novosphingobium sp. 1949]|uniref:Uncharacterized protein n=1 Tax=Novosphingobium organovorum TaxID=2930092 RepID=A0ABT0BDY8_9SPHN|nr:hypothetical protein [Novosphingobium organovorum]MCJ2183259.1 hypothetical protein [Novosphingobium organovorum]